MLKKGILVIFKANIISLLFNLLTSFLLPKYLTVDSYAAIKTFQLYVTYVGLFHLGYADGMYLKYGGICAAKIDSEGLKSDIDTLIVFQLVVTCVTVAISSVLRDWIWFAFSLSIFPLNVASYYKLLFQATGEFERYGKITNITTFFTFAINMLLLFVAQCVGDARPYVVMYLVVDFVILLILERAVRSEFKITYIKASFEWKVLFDNIKNGILLMLGNLSTAVFTGMDRWFVKVLLDVVAFAQYSFAVSIENFLNVAITPISVTFYNYFCIHRKSEDQKMLLRYIMIFGSVLPICLFPAKFVLEHYLVHYLDSMKVITFLFAAQSYAIINKCIYINLYKSQRKQKRYFVKLIIVIVMGFLFNVLFYLLIRDKVAFAIGTMCSNIFWFSLSSIDFPELKLSIRELTYLASESVLLIIFGNNLQSIIGFFAYGISTCILTLFMMRDSMKQLMSIIKLKGM